MELYRPLKMLSSMSEELVQYASMTLREFDVRPIEELPTGAYLEIASSRSFALPTKAAVDAYLESDECDAETAAKVRSHESYRYHKEFLNVTDHSNFQIMRVEDYVRCALRFKDFDAAKESSDEIVLYLYKNHVSGDNGVLLNLFIAGERKRFSTVFAPEAEWLMGARVDVVSKVWDYYGFPSRETLGDTALELTKRKGASGLLSCEELDDMFRPVRGDEWMLWLYALGYLNESYWDSAGGFHISIEDQMRLIDSGYAFEDVMSLLYKGLDVELVLDALNQGFASDFVSALSETVEADR